VERGSGTDNRGIAVAPIVPIAGKNTRLPSLKEHLATIAIMFDFVNPVLAFGWLIDRGSKLGFDKLKRHSDGSTSLVAGELFLEGCND
jgi:hypothetical protein